MSNLDKDEPEVQEIAHEKVWWIDCEKCCVGTEVSIDSSRVKTELLTSGKLKPKKWRPAFCPNCGRKVK